MQLGAGPGWAGPCQLEGACSSESAMAKQMDGRGGVTGALPDGGLLWLAVLKTWAGSALPPCPCRLQAGHTLLGCSGHCYWKQSLEDRCGWVMAGAWLGAACSGAGVLRVPRAGGGGPTTVSGLQLLSSRASSASGTYKCFEGGNALGLSQKCFILPRKPSRFLGRRDRRSGNLPRVHGLGDK